MQRWAIGLEYLGAPFAGWQHQDHAITVQQVVEHALSTVADAPVSLVAAGRTDAGVHASGQVAHFDTPVHREPRSWLLGANSNLPEAVSIAWVSPVAAAFHARYSATSRSYQYLILNREVRCALLADRSWCIHGALDVTAMQAGADHLIGEHDFSAFRAAECQARTPRRQVRELFVKRTGDLITIECRANAFLHHMVRNIVGSLVTVGRHQEPPNWIAGVLASMDRRRAAMTAPAQGLSLARVDYPAEFDIPPPRRWPSDL